jgi:hypothetical protein
MAGLAQEVNPREIGQEHSQEWLCNGALSSEPQMIVGKGSGLREKTVGSC